MIKSHSLSPNHKVVMNSPHSFHMPGNAPKAAPANGPTGGGSAEPAGGGAQGPAPEMFSDGGEPSAIDKIVSGAKDVWNQLTNSSPKTSDTADPVDSAQKTAQKGQNKRVDDAVNQAVNGDD